MPPLPKRPERSAPIPNDPFESPEVSSIRGPYWDMPLGSGLEPDGQGSVQTAGSEPSAPAAYLYGANGFVGVGTGLQIGPGGELSTSGYVYCTPAYPELPPTEPPYGCSTEVNTSGVTSLQLAWQGCSSLTSFPCIDTSSVTNFAQTWEFCFGLTSFPPIDTSSGVNFYSAWYNCNSLTSFPLLNVSSGVDFSYAWSFCESLTSFPPLGLSLGENFEEAWFDCANLVLFPARMFDNCPATNFSYAWSECALSQSSVDNILISLDTAGQPNGKVDIERGTSSPPGPAGLSAKASLEAKGWTVTTN